MPVDPFSSIPSINGGDAGPSNAQADAGQTSNVGGLFSPFYFGGSGGGLTGSISTIALIGVVLWFLFKK